MATKNYKALKEQLAKLEAETEAARIAELAAVVADIREKVAEYGITPEQIFGRQRASSKRKTAGAPVAAKYHNPKTGETWSGRGRAPAWIKDAKNRDRFLIAE
ncbi:H-NS histone family protein [Burkholderia vietnamiensis]|uniref:H-NS histone family protein n=1 Tax=Burkholderia vietnamiensis TaxID=60552 RepID=UPI0018DC36D9|nr:H-NS histone family protein [Burkholderia vietnamiensis]MBH9642359.1 H-NS histone family protein [Burkholderia vietnamiensis]HDR9248823.1 H-NS histone family protein [Burkholderia vietnamiensis]